MGDPSPDEWDALFAEASRPAPYYGRRMMTAHRAAGLADDVRLLALRTNRRLVALLPWRACGARLGWHRVHCAWTTPYITAGAPVVAADDLAAHVDALLDAMAAAGPVWSVPHLALNEPVACAMTTALAERHWPSAVVAPEARPILDLRDPSPAGAAEGRRAKDLARRRRRLAERGRVTHDFATGGPDLAAALAAFLTLEASGWKGRAGSALASRPGTTTLARGLFAEPDGPVRPRIDLLRLDGQPVAGSLALLSGDTAYLWKSAYDETLAAFAPGLLIEAAMIEAARRSGFAARLNSATMTGGALDRIYPGREAVGRLVFATDPAAAGRFDRWVAAERWKIGALDTAKNWRDRLRSGGS